MSNSLSRQLRTTLFYALRTAFRLTPMPQATRDRLRQRFLDTRGHWVPEGPKGKAPTGELPRRPYVRSDERAIGYVPYEQGELPDPLPATLVAFYLPQFHTIPENDEWWGKGFTEWRNVARALPQFEGHHQPKLPGDLGFYDLRNVEVMHEQARLAREYGISAFCFYFYWFGGKTLLETPLRNWLNDKSIDLEFCLCWANEKWTRTWDGRGDEILIDQQHSPEDDIAFIEYVAEYMRDPRYLRVDGKPMLLVYRPGLFPDMAATALRWRRWCRDNGIGEIHLAYVQSFERPDPAEIGFDAAVEFPPSFSSPTRIAGTQQLLNPEFKGAVLDWRDMSSEYLMRSPTEYLLHRGANPGWDNEARRSGAGRIFFHAAPRRYRDWLTGIVAKSREVASSSPLIFVNAWNEWAEGATLEPDATHGYAALEATRHALRSTAGLMEEAPRRPCAVIHAWYLDEFGELLKELERSGLDWNIFVTTSSRNLKAIQAMVEHCRFAATVIAVENRGRDILPFLRLANRLLDSGVDIVLKLHTKRSPHLSNGDAWRRELIGRLVAQGRARTIMSAFDADSRLGLVGPEGHILPIAPFIGGNRGAIDRLWRRMALSESVPEDGRFVSGSMFWVRLAALRPLLDTPVYESQFEVESGQTDGTLAHALERIFGICAEAAGFTMRSSAAIIGRPDVTTETYAYARANNPHE
ncbi:glycoside hydrolase family 99-like domain-containing protein [Pseudoxanthomonas sp. F37]|uniref:glycoside hydrolase family 99-like domain-containing protein n=1 Tax=Pseudoxanthomonas TaxID=83618 RepID=UPI0031F30828